MMALISTSKGMLVTLYDGVALNDENNSYMLGGFMYTISK